MPPRQTKFRNTMYVTTYQLAREGHNDTMIAKTLGVQHISFRAWCAKDPALRDALARGRAEHAPGHTAYTFHDYVFEHLTPELRELWNQIHAFEELENRYEVTEAILANHGTRTRQCLFIHALTKSCFNVSKSLKMFNIPRRHYDNWCHNDPEFQELINEIKWHKDNFIEGAFMNRVRAGDTTAIIHAVKTQLRHRGYNDKVEVEVSGTVQHQHTVSVAELDLDLPTRRALLAALRAHRDATDTTATPTPALALAQ